jgi:hypothetical protein
LSGQEALKNERDEEKTWLNQIEKEKKLKEDVNAKKYNTIPLLRISAKKLTQIKKGGGNEKALKDNQFKNTKRVKKVDKKEKKEKKKDKDEGDAKE